MTTPGIYYRPAAIYGRSLPAGPVRTAHLAGAENLLATATPRPADVAQLTPPATPPPARTRPNAFAKRPHG